MDIRVSCVADLDVPPAEAGSYLRKTSTGEARRTAADMTDEDVVRQRESKAAKPGGEPVKTFVSPLWTLEHDLALCGLPLEMHIAIQLAAKSKTTQDGLGPESTQKTVTDAVAEYKIWRVGGKTKEEIAALVYRPLYDGRASKVETAQYLAGILDQKRWTVQQAEKSLRARLPRYLVDAIDYATRRDNDQGLVAPEAANGLPN